MLRLLHVHRWQLPISLERDRKLETHRAGWDGVTPISAGGESEISLSFLRPARRAMPDMAHCHNLEPEGSEIMAQFTIM